jgi:hypothetical protein
LSSALDILNDVNNFGRQPGESTYVRYEKEGRKFISSPIGRGKIPLQLLFMEKKTTWIYYNEDDPDMYFFDLKFAE